MQNSESDLKRISAGLALILVIAIAVGVVLNFRCPMGIKHPKSQKVQRYISSLSSAIKLYQLENGMYPTSEQGLEALVTNPSYDLENWKQYLREIKKDPWGSSYIYKKAKTHDQEFLIYSIGPDGVNSSGARDDIVSWDKEYECKYYQTCTTVCEYTRDLTFIIALCSVLLLVLCFAYFLVRLVVVQRNA